MIDEIRIIGVTDWTVDGNRRKEIRCLDLRRLRARFFFGKLMAAKNIDAAFALVESGTLGKVIVKFL